MGEVAPGKDRGLRTQFQGSWSLFCRLAESLSLIQRNPFPPLTLLLGSCFSHYILIISEELSKVRLCLLRVFFLCYSLLGIGWVVAHTFSEAGAVVIPLYLFIHCAWRILNLHCCSSLPLMKPYRRLDLEGVLSPSRTMACAAFCSQLMRARACSVTCGPHVAVRRSLGMEGAAEYSFSIQCVNVPSCFLGNPHFWTLPVILS